MANQRGTFAKRQREMDLKDKARAKDARRAAKKDEQRATKGPQIAWDQPGGLPVDGDAPPATSPSPDDPADDPPSPGDSTTDDT
jgi:hypothetical protein